MLGVRLGVRLRLRGGQPFSQVGQNLEQKNSGGQIFDQKYLGGPPQILQFQQNCYLEANLNCISHLKKFLRAIPEAQAGQKWPAGPALAAPGLGVGFRC